MEAREKGGPCVFLIFVVFELRGGPSLYHGAKPGILKVCCFVLLCFISFSSLIGLKNLRTGIGQN